MAKKQLLRSLDMLFGSTPSTKSSSSSDMPQGTAHSSVSPPKGENGFSHFFLAGDVHAHISPEAFFGDGGSLGKALDTLAFGKTVLGSPSAVIPNECPRDSPSHISATAVTHSPSSSAIDPLENISVTISGFPELAKLPTPKQSETIEGSSYFYGGSPAFNEGGLSSLI
jgi:hypothetical protein